MLISKEKLIAELEAIKAEKGRLYPPDYRDTIENAPEEVASTGDYDCWHSVKRRLPDTEYGEYLVIVKHHGGVYEQDYAQYSTRGFHNDGRNKWSCENIIGPGAGRRVIAWREPDDICGVINSIREEVDPDA